MHVLVDIENKMLYTLFQSILEKKNKKNQNKKTNKQTKNNNIFFHQVHLEQKENSGNS